MTLHRALAHVAWTIYRKCSFDLANPVHVSAARRMYFDTARPRRRTAGSVNYSLTSVRRRLTSAYRLRNAVSCGWRDDLTMLLVILHLSLHDLSIRVPLAELLVDKMRYN